MIRRINGTNEIEDYGTKIFKRSTLIFCVLTSLYLGQGILKSFGEIENQEIARKNEVPAIEQSYTDYLCLGAKNLAGKILSSIK